YTSFSRDLSSDVCSSDLGSYFSRLQKSGNSDVCDVLEQEIERLEFVSALGADGFSLDRKPLSVKTVKAGNRDKRVHYKETLLPKLEVGTNHMPHKVVEATMKAFAQDDKVVSIDSDLSSTSGLQAG